jgi:hypothetical protein
MEIGLVVRESSESVGRYIRGSENEDGEEIEELE